MPSLKYKNGNTWSELQFGGGGLDAYPVGSIYIAPSIPIFKNYDKSYQTYHLFCPWDESVTFTLPDKSTQNSFSYTQSPAKYNPWVTNNFISPSALFGGTWKRFLHSGFNGTHTTETTSIVFSLDNLVSAISAYFLCYDPNGNAMSYPVSPGVVAHKNGLVKDLDTSGASFSDTYGKTWEGIFSSIWVRIA